MAFNDTIHYALPKLLLTVTALHQASFGTSEYVRSKSVVDEVFNAGAASGSTKVALVYPDDAGEDTSRPHTCFLILSWISSVA